MTAGACNEEKTAPEPSPDAIASYKRRVAARVAEIKRGLAQWIKQTTSFGDYTAVTTALLELAFDRHLADRSGTQGARIHTHQRVMVVDGAIYLSVEPESQVRSRLSSL